jgi:hypothetical protein
MKYCAPRTVKLPGMLAVMLLTWWLTVPVYALTASEIISQARVLLNDTASATARQRFSDAQLLGWLNDGQREANIFSWVLRSSYTIITSSGTQEYSLPSDYLTTWRVTQTGIKLPQTSIDSLDADTPGWKTSTGKPQKYYIYNASTNLIGVVPYPVTNTSTTTVVVYYIQQPTEITSLSSSPWNGWNVLAPYHSGLIYYIAYRGYLANLDANTSTAYFNEWSLYVTSLKEALLRAPDYNPGFSGQRK